MAKVLDIEYSQPFVGSTSTNPGTVIGTIQVGGKDTLLIADMEARNLLGAILIELKKLNLRQQEVFEETVKDGDVDG